MIRPSLVAIALLVPSISWAQEDPAKSQEAQKPDNSVAIKALVRLTRDQDPAVRMTAFSALARIGEEMPGVVEAVQSGLKDDDRRVRVEAFFALNSAIRDSKIQVNALLTLIQDDDEELAMKAAEQLGRLGQPAVPHLLTALENEKTRSLIVRTLGSIGGEAREAIPALAELLKSDDASLRMLVATCLADICNPRPKRSSASFSRTRSRLPDGPTMQRFLDAMWARYDTDGDDSLSPEEQTAIRSLDDSVDRNGDKSVSRTEFSEWYSAKLRERFDGGRPATPFGGGFGGRR